MVPQSRNMGCVVRLFLKALFALPMSAAELQTFRECTGRDEPPVQVTEGWLVCGRRAGKSFILALTAVYLAIFRDYIQFLAPGERATVVIIACDRRQARIIFRYIKALLSQVPMLAHLIQRETAEGLDLCNRVTIEIHTASFRKTRGYAIAAALLDQLAFQPTDDAAEPDHEIIAALKPGMATIPGAMLLCASSPYQPPWRAVALLRPALRQGQPGAGLESGNKGDEPDRCAIHHRHRL